VGAAVVVEELRLDVLAAHVGGDVDVCDEADRRRVRVAGERAVDDAVLGQLGLEPEFPQLRDEQALEVELTLGARCGVGVGVGRRPDPRVANEPVARVGPELARKLAAVAVTLHGARA
jgi:hypothetical protein